MKERSKSGSRRDFLKTGVSTFAGMAILPSVLGNKTQVQEKEKERHKIVTRELGKTGLELPVLSFGVGHVTDKELVTAALDAGIVMLDTAHSYGRGRNEEMIGQVIKGRPRDSFVVTTKVSGPEDRRTGLFTKDATSKLFREKFETSLTRLGLDYVDILLIHSVVNKEATMYEPFVSELVKLKKEGKVRFIGVSTHGSEPEVIRAVTESGVHEVVLTAYNFRQPHVKEVELEIAKAAKAGIGVIAMKTQAGVYWDREREHMINMKAALKWVLRNENVHTTIPGMTTFEQLEANLSVMGELELTPEEKKELQLGQQQGLPGLYCRQCGYCISQCAMGLDIPTLMRSYMYVYGYRNLAAAKEAVREVKLLERACLECNTCTVKCSMGFDVKSKVKDISRLRQVPEDFVV